MRGYLCGSGYFKIALLVCGFARFRILLCCILRVRTTRNLCDLKSTTSCSGDDVTGHLLLAAALETGMADAFLFTAQLNV